MMKHAFESMQDLAANLKNEKHWFKDTPFENETEYHTFKTYIIIFRINFAPITKPK